MERVVTNFVKLSELKKEPCEHWLKYFNEDGVADAHEAFIMENKYPYDWIYENTNIDLIRWEIENNCFNWEKNSWAVAEHCPDKIDPMLFYWKKDEWAVRKYCPEKLELKLT